MLAHERNANSAHRWPFFGRKGSSRGQHIVPVQAFRRRFALPVRRDVTIPCSSAPPAPPFHMRRASAGLSQALEHAAEGPDVVCRRKPVFRLAITPGCPRTPLLPGGVLLGKHIRSQMFRREPVQGAWSLAKQRPLFSFTVSVRRGVVMCHPEVAQLGHPANQQHVLWLEVSVDDAQ